MAHIEDNNNRRSSNVDINIVPFIDLMSVLIIFLLISAVWTQVSMIQIGSSVYGKKSDLEPAEPPPRAEVPFRLDVLSSGYRVIVGNQTIRVPKINNNYDKNRLTKELSQIKKLYPEKVDAVMTMTDSLAYVFLIEGMDALLSTGFPEISIATGGSP